MWIHLGEADDPAWRRSGRGSDAGAVAVPSNPETAAIDEEIQRLLEEVDGLLAEHAPGTQLDVIHDVMAVVLQRRLGRLKGADTDAFADQLQRRLASMARDLEASESELARLREKLSLHPALAHPSVAPSGPGTLANRQDFKKRLSLLTRIVEENIRLRSGGADP